MCHLLEEINGRGDKVRLESGNGSLRGVSSMDKERSKDSTGGSKDRLVE